MAHQNLVLPFRGEQFSFALNTKADGDAAKPAVVDFAAVAFDRQGQFLDVVHAHKATALMGAICTHREPSMWPEGCQAVPGEDVVHVMPKLLEPKAEVLVLVASVAHNPGQAQDLSSASKLELTITFATEEDNRALDNHVTVNLTDTANYLASQGQGQSMLLGVVFLDQPGWTVRFDHAGSAVPSWSLMVPELQAAVLRVKSEAGVPLDAAVALEQNPPEDSTIVPFSRLYEDRALDEGTRFRLPDAGSVGKLRVDVGWKFWKKGPEDEIEGAAVEFVIKFYNAAGEEVQSAGTNEREAQGVAVGRPEPEEGEEAAEEEPPAEEEEAAEGEGEGGEEGEEGAEPKEPPPPPPEPAEDPYEFKLRDVAFITLEELPKDVRSLVVLVSNYAGAGFLPLKHAGAKLFDVTGGEDKARPLAEWHHISKFEQEDKVTQVALLKVYKEYGDSAWNLWRLAGAKGVGEFVATDPKLLMAALKEAQAKHKAWKALEAKALADAEESGEEVAKDLRAHHWRYSVPGLVMGGESLEAAEHDIKNNLLNYDGPLRSLEARSCSCARVQFGGEKPDTYFGGYQEDLKDGSGVYCFATGAFYVGNYKGGKREGTGVMLLPDGGEYVGEFAADRFHGQGQYRYPDGSVYTGAWEAGAKHGPGVYWDTKKGCLRGSWAKGTLAGTATYDQPAISFQGEFVAGVPAGPGQFTIAAHRTLDLHKFAASHILDTGPTLRGKVEYAIPAGSGDPPKLDEEGQPIEDPDKPPLPAFPKYEGLGFKSTSLPISIVDKAFPPEPTKVPTGTLATEREEATMVFPPAGGLPVPIKEVPRFAVPTGLLPPEPEQAEAVATA